jgi:hypothetical protein
VDMDKSGCNDLVSISPCCDAQATAPRPKRVAVMQPYFFPYAGYFRLLHAVDDFVIFDCVQFPRRGRVHRTQVPGPTGQVEWLTLPLARHSRDTLIRDLAFAPDARASFDKRLGRYSWLAGAREPRAERLQAYLHGPLDSVTEYLEGGLKLIAELLGLTPTFSRSSVLGLDPTLKAQERVIAVVKAVGGTHYVNPPGGRRFYDADAFAKAGLRLSFLVDYCGPYTHLLPALVWQPVAAIVADIRASSRLELSPFS